MRVTSKGQVTIPVDIRLKFGLLPGTEVEFVVEDERVSIVPRAGGPSDGRGTSIVRRLRGSGTVRMSTEEILALTREP
jgi:AbrB family looped-hinge helix DNA binding protein